MIVSFDGSSTRVGYAIFHDHGKLESFGLIDAPKGWEANRRILKMAQQMENLAKLSLAKVVLLEDCSGKMNRMRRGGGAGIDIYGKAVGFYWATVAKVAKVEMISSRVWTRGRPKGDRQDLISMQFSGEGYVADDDPGGDTSDAIGMALWWFVEQKIKRASMTPEGT
jgi:hypothetical protein